MLSRRLQRNTQQRELILGQLRKLSSHPTAAALHEIVRRGLPKISLGTVYRNLQLLARTGQIQKLDFGSGESRFDGNPQHHDHVRCVRCGRVDDFPGTPLDLFQGSYHDCGGYEIHGHRLEFFGVCPRCRAGRRTDRAADPHHGAR